MISLVLEGPVSASAPITAPAGIGAVPGTAAAALLLQAPEEGWRVWLAVATDVATVIIAIALLITAFVLLAVALQVRKLIRKVDPLIKQVQSHVDPVLGHVRDVGENVNYMSAAIRADVQHLTELVDSTRNRLNRTADAAEQRIREFNALLGVMQEEAEQLFIDTASTVRGVRAGTTSYRRLSADGDEAGPIENPPERASTG